MPGPAARLLAEGRRVGAAALDLVLPPRCLSCGLTVADHGSLCVACWRQTAFIGPPHCACCGFPFDFPGADAALCASCAVRRPPFERARAALAYDADSRSLILGFKHGDATHAAPAFGRWMARAGAELLAEADLIAPVPMHRLRLLARRYNQAALLAAAVRDAWRATGHARLPDLVPDLLARTRRTPPLGALDPGARRRRVRGAIALRPRHAARLAGRRVLLVDDVLTTGATASACAVALRDGGASAVDVLTLARVPRPLPLD